MNTLTSETPIEAALRLAAVPLSKGFEYQALHEYTDAKGAPLYWRIRLKNPETGEKFIRPMKLVDSEYSFEEPSYPNGKPLYQLHHLVTRPNEMVYVVEGEWCADELAKIGVLTTTSGGADSAERADWSVLSGCMVTIWPDNDEAGSRYANTVVKILKDKGCTLHIINLEAMNLAPKDDVVDWLKTHSNTTQADLENLPTVETNTTERADDLSSHNGLYEPEPLRAELLPADPYPVEALGDILGEAAMAIHMSVKAPLALCCQSVLAAASLAVQPHYNIKLPWGEIKPLSLYLLTVGESGERKSGVDDLVLGAAKAQERAEMEEYALELQDYEAELAAWSHATDSARKATNGGKGTKTAADVRTATERCGEKPKHPIVPLRFVTDPTIEGLFKLLAIGNPSVALFSDEGGLLIGGHALNSDNAIKTLARLCKFWDGSSFDRVRAGDGTGVLYGRRLSLHQLAQPDVMMMLLSDRMANGQGFLARCLVAWPESTIGTRHIEQFEWAGDRCELKRLFAVLKQLMEATPLFGISQQELNPVELPLTDEAKMLAVEANNQFELLMAAGADLGELRDRTSKAVENACRMAGILAVIEGGLKIRTIESIHLERALILMQWYLSEALRIRGASTIPQSVIDAEMLSKWLHHHDMKQFRLRQILKSGPNQIRNKKRSMSAITELVVNGYLAENEGGVIVDGVAAKNSWRVLHYVV
jgi:hypothetical protein